MLLLLPLLLELLRLPLRWRQCGRSQAVCNLSPTARVCAVPGVVANLTAIPASHRGP